MVRLAADPAVQYAATIDARDATPTATALAALTVHDVARRCLVELLGLAADTEVAFVTGATAEHVTPLEGWVRSVAPSRHPGPCR